MQTRMIHDSAWKTARTIMVVIENLLREEEKRDCFLEIYERVKEGLARYEEQVRREAKRLARPSSN